MAKQEKEPKVVEKKVDKGLSPAEVRDTLIQLVRAVHLINNSVYFNDTKFRAMVMREIRGVVTKCSPRYPEIAEPLNRNFK